MSVRSRFEETQKLNFAGWWKLFFCATALFGVIVGITVVHWMHNLLLDGVTGFVVLGGCSGSIMLYILFGSMRTRVDGQGVHVKFGPLPWKTFDTGEIKWAAACTYNAKKEFGGWGMRVNLKGQDDSYTLNGDRGVRLTLRNAKPVLIGSERAEELEAAIEQLLAPPAKPLEECRSS